MARAYGSDQKAIQKEKVTPVEKVIELLVKLEGEVQAEGKEEAAAYDKFACFCKEQADEKLYAIEKSELNGQIADLSKTISNYENEIDMKTKKREKQHAE